jgi:hypothetical protein
MKFIFLLMRKLIMKNNRPKNAELKRKHEARAEAGKAAREEWKEALKTARENGAPIPDKPAAADEVGNFIEPRLFVSNATVERLGMLLQARPQGMLMLADELSAPNVACPELQPAEAATRGGITPESITQSLAALLPENTIVVDDSTPILDVALKTAKFYRHESCGKCTPCREGSWWATRVLERIQDGYGRDGDVGLMRDMGTNILFRAFCALADGTASVINSSLQHFEAEFEAHIREGRCPAKNGGSGGLKSEALSGTRVGNDAER